MLRPPRGLGLSPAACAAPAAAAEGLPGAVRSRGSWCAAVTPQDCQLPAAEDGRKRREPCSDGLAEPVTRRRGVAGGDHWRRLRREGSQKSLPPPAVFLCPAAALSVVSAASGPIPSPLGRRVASVRNSPPSAGLEGSISSGGSGCGDVALKLLLLRRPLTLPLCSLPGSVPS